MQSVQPADRAPSKAGGTSEVLERSARKEALGWRACAADDHLESWLALGWNQCRRPSALERQQEVVLEGSRLQFDEAPPRSPVVPRTRDGWGLSTQEV